MPTARWWWMWGCMRACISPTLPPVCPWAQAHLGALKHPFQHPRAALSWHRLVFWAVLVPVAVAVAVLVSLPVPLPVPEAPSDQAQVLDFSHGRGLSRRLSCGRLQSRARNPLSQGQISVLLTHTKGCLEGTILGPGLLHSLHRLPQIHTTSVLTLRLHSESLRMLEAVPWTVHGQVYIKLCSDNG